MLQSISQGSTPDRMERSDSSNEKWKRGNDVHVVIASLSMHVCAGVCVCVSREHRRGIAVLSRGGVLLGFGQQVGNDV